MALREKFDDKFLSVLVVGNTFATAYICLDRLKDYLLDTESRTRWESTFSRLIGSRSQELEQWKMLRLQSRTSLSVFQLCSRVIIHCWSHLDLPTLHDKRNLSKRQCLRERIYKICKQYPSYANPTFKELGQVPPQRSSS